MLFTGFMRFSRAFDFMDVKSLLDFGRLVLLLSDTGLVVYMRISQESYSYVVCRLENPHTRPLLLSVS